jgi:hypothetical protein
MAIYTEAIDRGTGNFGASSIAERKGWENVAFEPGHETLTHSGSSPVSALRANDTFAIDYYHPDQGRGFFTLVQKFLIGPGSTWKSERGLHADSKQFAAQVRAKRIALEATVLSLPAP